MNWVFADPPERTRTGYFGQPLAPVSLPVLVSVGIASAILLLGAARITNEYGAITACVLAVVACASVLDVVGRRRAKTHPHPLLKANRLPSDSMAMKALLYSAVVSALIILMLYANESGRVPTPWPFFLTVAFLYLIAPQIQARRAIRLYDRRKAASNTASTGAKKSSEKAAKTPISRGD